MTNGKDCECKWEGDRVVSECGAHFEFFKEQMQPLIEIKAELERIKIYAKNEHPILSSRACPLCEWTGTVEGGMWKGTNRKPCSYHFALNQLYALKIEGEKDIWKNEN